MMGIGYFHLENKNQGQVISKRRKMKFTRCHPIHGVRACFFMVLLFLLCFMCAASLVRSDNIHSVFITAIQNEQTHATAKEVLREAYRRIGYNVRFETFPGQRSIVMANNGESDGDVARIAGTEKEFPNLIPVPTPVILFKGMVFTKNITREIKTWKDLEGLNVGIIRGIRYSEIGTRGLSRYYAEDMTHLFRLLDQDRIQVAIAVSMAGKIEISKNFRFKSYKEI